MLHNLDPDTHSYKERPYEPGTMFKMVGGTRANQTVLKGKDRKALLSAVAANANAIAQRDPQEFVQLQKDIEVVSLDRLIDSMGRYIKRNVKEADWQKLLEVNPFLLSMLFGQPIVMLQAGASVGGTTLAGPGNKIADFLTQHSQSYNASIVELKRAGMDLLLASDYNLGVFAPSSDLTKAVVQVLDQRLKLANEVAGIKHRSRIHNLETYAVDCVIVAGTFPTKPDRMASFEMYRSQLKDVRIITYDELLERVKTLREQLSGERYEGNEDDEDDFPDSETIERRPSSYSDFDPLFDDSDAIDF
jgi:chorismate mutase